MAALIARGQGSKVSLLTLSGAIRQRGVREIELTSTLAEVTAAAGGLTHGSNDR